MSRLVCVLALLCAFSGSEVAHSKASKSAATETVRAKAKARRFTRHIPLTRAWRLGRTDRAELEEKLATAKTTLGEAVNELTAARSAYSAAYHSERRLIRAMLTREGELRRAEEALAASPSDPEAQASYQRAVERHRTAKRERADAHTVAYEFWRGGRGTRARAEVDRAQKQVDSLTAKLEQLDET